MRSDRLTDCARRVASQNGVYCWSRGFCRDALAFLCYIFQIFGANFDCGKLVNHLEGENESQSVAFSNQNTLQALHRAALDADLLADDKLSVRLHVPAPNAGAQQFDLCIRNRHLFPVVADYVDDPGRLQHLAALPTVYMHEQVGWEQGKHSANALPVLPNSDRFVSRQK